MSLWSPTTVDPTSPTSPTHARSGSMSFAGPSTKQKYKGKKIAQIVKLKPDCVKQYKECHAKVWPEVLKQIRDCNIEDCRFCGVVISFCGTPAYLRLSVLACHGFSVAASLRL